MSTDLVIRGKHITPEVLCQIQEVAKQSWRKGRTAISRELCLLWDWRQENGALKDQVCRILLRRLEDKQLITLPPPQKGLSNHPERRYYIPPDPPPQFPKAPLEGRLKDFPAVRLRMVRRTRDEALWNYLVYRYHYKSYRIIVGAHLKYIAYLEDVPVACLAWSASVFRIESRDLFIGWDREARSANIRHIANNNRFLILPWVRIKNLASHLLASSARVIARDWANFYGYPLYLLETFVDRSRFAGTCYRAANWYQAGQTKGHAKKKARFYYHGQKKDVYLYPLVCNFRKQLASAPNPGGVL